MPKSVPPYFVRKLWLLVFDHEVCGIYWSSKTAGAAKELRAKLGEQDLHVVGPYVLSKSAMKQWE